MKAAMWMLAAACLLGLAGCGSSAQRLIVGKWEVQNAPMKMTAEFKDDGTASINMFGQTVRGTYKLIGEDQLEWSVNGRTTKTKIKVTSTELELTDNSNQTVKYKRV